jgi:hypothetical protein
MSYLSSNKSEFRERSLGSADLSVKELSINREDLFLNKNGITWHDEGKEIEFNDEYFEVSNIILGEKLASIILVKDKAESDLLNSFLTNSKKKFDLLFSFFKMLGDFNSLTSPAKNNFYFTFSTGKYSDTISSLISGITGELFRPPSI